MSEDVYRIIFYGVDVAARIVFYQPFARSAFQYRTKYVSAQQVGEIAETLVEYKPVYARQNEVEFGVVGFFDVDTAAFAAKVRLYPEQYFNAVFFFGCGAVGPHLPQLFSAHTESGMRKPVIGYSYPVKTFFFCRSGIFGDRSLAVTVNGVGMQIKIYFHLRIFLSKPVPL